MGRYGFIRVKGIVHLFCFFEGFQLFDDTVCIFGIAFCNPCLNTGCVKERHGSFLCINTMADRFGQVNKMIEQGS